MRIGESLPPPAGHTPTVHRHFIVLPRTKDETSSVEGFWKFEMGGRAEIAGGD